MSREIQDMVTSSLPLLEKDIYLGPRDKSVTATFLPAVWDAKLADLNKYQLENSDVITYHNYNNDTLHRKAIDSLRLYKQATDMH